ncbi:MAG: VIT domain-containing protein, partial [Thermoguttaceae bacterium]
MNADHNNPEEEKFAALFAALDKDAAPVDAKLKEQLRIRSAEAFAAGLPAKSPQQKRIKRMLLIALRGLTAAAAVVVVATTFWLASSPGEPALAFEKVLEKMADAETVHLQVTRDGSAGEAWVKKPKQFRWNAPDGTYRIARGKRLWQIDEKANKAASGPSPFFHAERPGLDLFAVLDLPAREAADALAKAGPAEQIKRDGHQYDVYRAKLSRHDGPISIEALVDSDTQLLRSLAAHVRRGDRTEQLGRVDVLAVNEPIDEEKFVVGDTLTEDGRIGKITDSQGIVTLKPVMHNRWTPVTVEMLVKPGDWLRTDVRGANAAKVRLAGGTEVTLGPGSLAELVMPGEIRLIHGELKIAAEKKHPLQLLAPNDQKLTVKGSKLFRLDNEKLVPVKKNPLWLKGFEGTTTNQSIGSLVAKIDGRNVPLTVGYHKVTVDIRDQIARTVIEESFVNHTDGRLEGVFYFPLPQDASISGFGMWIGNELVEADVVEKQRAREIYETILREKRDPGLLEWAGGNLFKARVFPIFAHSEKRIKITYTQVLPLRGDRYRYSYGLQSEMLKQHPLRELSLDVKINSAVPLAKVTSPTHTARIDSTSNSAHVEFTAQEYTPKRDFEVVVQLDREQSDVVVIPHRRGEDGYFMMQLTPPDGQGQWQRDIVPDGQPLRLLILADTSASLDRVQRATQAEFIASLLATLAPDDTFNLAGCDVGCDWVFKQPQAATPENVKAARRFIEGRLPLGWTDLDKAFASALRQCDSKTRVIYVGDGITTTGDGDPVAFSKRLRRMCEDKAAGFHSVAVGHTFEPLVMKTIAALGGGTVRQISGEKTPPAVALELLGEIASPAIGDLKVEFRGLRTARVYPEELPNLPAGTQQILLGRYLPEGEDRDQQGEVIVTGTRDGRPIRFKAKVSLKDAEQGNSFIPRLWARMHLDVLLQQGTSQTI